MNLRNAEATFGKNSSQYADIMEIIENFMSTMGQNEVTSTPIAKEEDSKPQALQMTNLVFRPKP